MNKIGFIFLVCTVFLTCKNNANQETKQTVPASKSYSQNDGFITMRGDFVYMSDAAVLQTSNEIYGVVIDKTMQLLEAQVRPYKKEPIDMVPVTVRVRRFKKSEDEEGWLWRVQIVDIIKVEAPQPNNKDVIKLAN